MIQISKPKPQSVLSIDVGHKRIGIAGCDPLGITISRLPALHRRSFDEDLITFKRLCISRNVKGLVIGLPLDSEGFPTKQARHCWRYGKKIARNLALPMAFVNEHTSSWAAGESYGLHNDRTGQLDSAAAGLLLDQWLREGPELKPVGMQTYAIRHVN